MLLKKFVLYSVELRRFVLLGVVGVLLFCVSTPATLAASLTITPSSARANDPFTINIQGPANAYVCVVDPGDTCSNPAAFISLGLTGTGQITTNVPAGTPAGPITFTAHFFSNRDINTEVDALRSTATITILAPNVPPTASPPTPIQSDLVCPLGLVKDGPTGLCLPTNPLTPATGSIVASSSVGQLIQRFLDILLTLAGVIAILFIVIGGYQYITSRGAEDQAKAGRKTMTYAIIGLIAVLLAYTGVNLVVRLITTGSLFS